MHKCLLFGSLKRCVFCNLQQMRLKMVILLKTFLCKEMSEEGKILNLSPTSSGISILLSDRTNLLELLGCHNQSSCGTPSSTLLFQRKLLLVVRRIRCVLCIVLAPCMKSLTLLRELLCHSYYEWYRAPEQRMLYMFVRDLWA